MAYGTCLQRIGMKPAYSELTPSVVAIFVNPETRPVAYCTFYRQIRGCVEDIPLAPLGWRPSEYESLQAVSTGCPRRI